MVKRKKHRSNRNHSLLRSVTFLVLLVIVSPAPAAVELKLDRDRVMVGETVTLTFITNDSRQSLETDLGVLEADFDILDRRTETQVSIVNGRQTALVRQLVTVEPKHDGDIQIPAFRFGNEVTKPVLLRVDPAPELAPGELPPVFIEVELSPTEGPYYVHAQFGLVVRMFYFQNLTEAAISQPAPAPASVRLLQEMSYQAERGGERYRVLERHYAIFPERSGELVIPAIRLTGRLVERQDSSIWQQTVRGRRVRAESDELTVPIEPKPSGFTGAAWQPARELKLSQKISSVDSLKVGEPVTRTVLVDAVGLEENMITEPVWSELADARIYPDQPHGITRDDGRWVLGHKEFRYAVVPEKEGELVLPELKVDWWDTRNNVQKTAVIPEHRLRVEAAILVPPVPAVPDQPQTGATEATGGAGGADGSFWKWLAALFAVLWLITVITAWRLGTRSAFRNDRTGGRQPVGEKQKDLLQAIRRACNRNDCRDARRLLQRWLKDYGPGRNTSLLEFAAACGNEFLARGLYALDSEGYTRDATGEWNGKAFWGQFESWRKATSGSDANNRAPVTDLYARENRVT